LHLAENIGTIAGHDQSSAGAKSAGGGAYNSADLSSMPSTIIKGIPDIAVYGLGAVLLVSVMSGGGRRR
jgi:hypothetical protein